MPTPSLRRLARVAFVSISIALSAQAQAPERPQDFVLRDVRLEAGADAVPRTVVVRSGRIDGIFAAEDVLDEEFPGTRTLEGGGRLLLPAFLDAYTRTGCATPVPEKDQDLPVDVEGDVRIDMRLANRKGIQPAFFAHEVLEIEPESLEAWRASGFGAALIAPGGELLSGSSSLVTLREAANRDRILSPEVFAHGAFQANGPGYPSTLMGYMAQLRQFFLDARWHADWSARFAARETGLRPPFDLELEAGKALVDGSRRLMVEAQSVRDIERWMRLAKEFELGIGVVGGREAWRASDRLADEGLALVLTLDWGDEVDDPGQEKKKEREERGEEGPGWEAYREPLEVRRERRRLWEERRDNGMRLSEAGIRFAFGSGEAAPDDLLGKVRELVEAGLEREVALASLTENAARILGVGERLGQVAVGFDATFALWDGDPLTEEEAEVDWIFVDGFHAELNADEDEEEEDGDEEEEADEEDEEESEESVADSADEPEGDLWGHAFGSESLRVPELVTGGNALIRGATIHSAVGEPFEGDVRVEDGKIAAIGEGLGAPAGAIEIDASGFHLAPGVVDTHSHMAIEGGINEGTLSITADCDISDVINTDDWRIYNALAGGVTTIQCLHGSANAIGGRSEVIKLRRDASVEEMRFPGAPQGIKFALGENPKRSNWGERDRYPGTRMGVESVFHRAFERAREYRDEWQRFEQARDRGEGVQAPRRDVRLEVLVGILDGGVQVHSHCYRADEILMLLRTAETYGFRIQTLQHVLEGYKVAHEIARHGAGTSTFSDWWSYKLEAYDAIPHNAGMLDEAGVVSTINSDSNEMIRRLYQEAAKSLRYTDIGAVRALRLATLNSAIQLGIEDRVGSIEVGKDADLALLTAPPLSIFARVEWTMVDGEIEFQRRDTFGFDAEPLQSPVLEESSPAQPNVNPDGGEVVAIVGGTLHPVTAPEIENGVLLLQDGRIAGLGVDLPVPAGARIVDASGRHVWPGMIALDAPLGLQEIGSVRGSVDTAEIGGNQPDVRVASSIHADSAHIPVTRSAGVTRAQVAPGGRGPMRGQSALIQLSGDTWEELVLDDGNMLHLSFPRFSNDPDEEDESAHDSVRELHALFDEAREYERLGAEAVAKGTRAPAYDPRLAALAPFALGSGRVALHARGAQTILAALEFAAEEELDAVLYDARESWKVVDAVRESGVPVVLGPIHALPGSRFDPYDAPYACAAVLHRAGVPVAIQAAESSNTRNLPFHAGTAVAFGLPREAALRAITLVPARILGIGDEAGSLTPGKVADVIVTDGDLFEPATRLHHIFIGGVPQPLGNRQTALYERYHGRLQRLSGR